MNIPMLTIGAFVILVAGKALIDGSATPDGQGLRRDEQPAIYWTVMLAAAFIASFLIYRGLEG